MRRWAGFRSTWRRLLRNVSHMTRARRSAAVAMGVLVLVSTRSLGLRAQVTTRQARVEVVVPKPPMAVTVDTQPVLVYELHVTNFGFGALALRELDIMGVADPVTRLASYRDSALRPMTTAVGSSMMADTPDTARLLPGGRIVVFVWLPLLPGERVPTVLQHRFLFDILDSATMASDHGTQEVLDSISVPVARGPIPVLQAPLQGGQWMAASAPSNRSGHRRSLTVINGHAFISQRFAIDWNMVGANGDTHHGDEHEAPNYWGFGQAVHSVAAGHVVAAVDTIVDHTPHTRLPPTTVASLPGNYITIRIGPDEYATYAHLQHGSVHVHVGQHVQAGQVIARVGLTGQSTAPHLHFQLTDGPSVLGSEGIPYVLRAYTDLGPGQEFEENRHPSIPRQHVLPGEDEVVALP
jgi:murein DD-endopeptidase